MKQISALQTPPASDALSGNMLGFWFLNNLRNHLLVGSYGRMPAVADVAKIDIIYERDSGGALLDVECRNGMRMNYFYDPGKQIFRTGSLGEYQYVFNYYTAQLKMRQIENGTNASLQDKKDLSIYRTQCDKLKNDGKINTFALYC